MSDLAQSLAQFCGSDQHYRHWSGRLHFTTGLHFLAEHAGAWWLIDLIASHQPSVAAEPFQLWTLIVQEDHTAVAECRADSTAPVLVQQELEFTDFPVALSPFRLYCVDGVLLLPTEY